MLKDNYACDGQMSIFDYMAAANEKQVELPDPEELPKDICQFSQHKCNRSELWRVADELDELQCPHVCCRKCNTRLCGARCNGSEEPQKADDIKIYPVVIEGLCDDAYCPNCGRGFMDPMENDLSECPLCHTKVDWAPWHKANDNEEIFEDETE